MLRGLFVFGGLFAIVIVFQIASGTWGSDFGKHADEGAHVVTSLMVRDYLAGGFLEQWHPMRYAESYYDQFPKVALGHYPPGFYLVAALVLLPIREPWVFLMLLAALAAFVGSQTWRLGRSANLPNSCSMAAAVLACVLPLTRSYTAIVMADLLLVGFSLLALEAWVRFRERPAYRWSILFGCWAAAAMLTKGSALALGLLPPFAILLGGRWDLLRNPRLWVAVIPVAVFAFPWYWLTREITAEGMQEQGVVDYFREATGFYVSGLATEMSWLVLGLILVGGAIAMVRLIRMRSAPGGCGPDFVAFCLGGFLLICAVPTGLDHRYLLPLIPVLLLIAVGLLSKVMVARGPRWVLGGMSLFVIGVVLLTWRTSEKRYTGAKEAVATVLHENRSSESGDLANVLVVSNAGGEGALTAAAAFQGKGQLRVLRGTKILATSDWMGRGYQSHAGSRNEFSKLLRKEEVKFLILEHPDRSSDVPPHRMQATEYLSTPGNDSDWQLISTEKSQRSGGRSTAFAVYEVTFIDPERSGTAP